MSEDRLSLTGRQPQAEQEEVLSLTGFSQELMSEEDAFEYANFASASLDESPEEYLARSRYPTDVVSDKDSALEGVVARGEQAVFEIAGTGGDPEAKLKNAQYVLGLASQHSEKVKYPHLFLQQYAPDMVEDYVDKMQGDRFARLATEAYDEERQTGFFNFLGDAADQFLSLGGLPNLIFGGSDRYAESDRLREMAYNPEVTDDQLKAEFKKVYREAADRGWFTDSNGWYVDAMQEELELGRAYDPVVNQETIAVGLSVAFGDLTILGSLFAKTAAATMKGTTALAANTLTRNRVNNLVAQASNTNTMNGNLLYQAIPMGGKAPNLFSGALDFHVLSQATKAGREMNGTYGLNNLMRQLPGANPINTEALNANYAAVKDWFVKKKLDVYGSRLLNGGHQYTGGAAGKAGKFKLKTPTETAGVVTTEQGNLLGWAMLGTQKGTGFKMSIDTATNTFSKTPTRAMQDALDKAGPGARLVQIAPDEMAIIKTFTLNPKDPNLKFLYDDLTLENQGFMGALENVLYSARAVLDPGTTASILRAEAAQSAAMAAMQKQIGKVFGGATKEELKSVETMLEAVVDGDLSTYTRQLTDSEFNAHFGQKFGRPPTPKEKELWDWNMELSDELWKLDADKVLKERIQQGFNEAHFIDGEWKVTRPKDLNVDDDVIDGTSKAPMTREQIEQSGAKGRFVELSDDQLITVGDKAYRHIWVSDDMARKAQSIRHENVLGYRPGFSRQYRAPKFFIKQNTTASLGGRKVAGKPLTIGLARSRKIGEQAVDQLNNILGEIAKRFPKRMSTKNVLDQMEKMDNASKAAITNVLLKNNAWDHSIDTFDKLHSFIREEGIDVFEKVGIAADSDAIQVMNDAGELVAGTTTFRDSLLRQSSSVHTRGKQLRNMEGGVAETLTPYESMLSGASRSLHYRSWREVLDTQAEQWWRASKEFISNAPNLEKAAPMQRLKAAELIDNPKAKRLGLARDAILRTQGLENKLGENLLNMYGDTLEDFIINNSKHKNATKLGIKAGNVIRNFPDHLRSLAYNVKLGLFNPVHLMVQASQMAQIMAVTSLGVTKGRNPLNIIKDGSAWFTIRAMRAASDNPDTVRGIAEATYATLGFNSADEFLDMYRAIQGTGRLDVAHTIADKGGMVAPDLSMAGSLQAIGEKSRMFFNEGERWGRGYAGVAAWREMVEKYGAKAAGSKKFMDEWWVRQDDLTFNMTSALSAPWQRSNLSLTFQFMTFFSRITEAITRRGGLSKGDRAALISGNIMMFGGAAGGMGAYLDEKRADRNSFWATLSPEEYTILRDGAIGALWSAAGIGDISERLSPVQGIVDFMERINEDDYVTVVSGPGGNTLASLVMDGGAVAINAVGNRPDTFLPDFQKFLSNASGYSNATKAYIAFMYGQAYNRDGGLVAEGISGTEALGILFGGTPKAVSDTYRDIAVSKSQKEMAIDLGKEMKRHYELAIRAREEGDFDTAAENFKYALAIDSLMTPWQRKTAKKIWAKSYESLQQRMLESKLKMGLNIYTQNAGEE